MHGYTGKQLEAIIGLIRTCRATIVNLIDDCNNKYTEGQHCTVFLSYLCFLYVCCVYAKVKIILFIISIS